MARTWFWRKVAEPDSQDLYMKSEVNRSNPRLIEAPLEATCLDKVSPIAAAWQVKASKGEDLDDSMWGKYGIIWPSSKRIKEAERVPWTLEGAVKRDPTRVFTAWNGYAYWLLKKPGNQVVPIGLTMDQRKAAKPWSDLRPQKPPRPKTRGWRRGSEDSESETSSASKPSKWASPKWGLAGPAKAPSRRVSLAS